MLSWFRVGIKQNEMIYVNDFIYYSAVAKFKGKVMFLPRLYVAILTLYQFATTYNY